MEQLINFVINHPYLVGIFAVLLVLFIRNEMVRGGASISAAQLVQLVNNENAVIVDVRDKGEFDSGHIVDSINIPFSSLETRADELNKYKDKPLVLTCKMGQHAGSAGTLLKKKGFENVSRLKGGIAEWRGQSLPVVKA